MTHDTHDLQPDEWRSTIEPAHAASEYPDADPPKRDLAIGIAAVALLGTVGVVLVCAVIAHVVAALFVGG
jgi:hypothetical protein